MGRGEGDSSLHINVSNALTIPWRGQHGTVRSVGAAQVHMRGDSSPTYSLLMQPYIRTAVRLAFSTLPTTCGRGQHAADANDFAARARHRRATNAGGNHAAVDHWVQTRAKKINKKGAPHAQPTPRPTQRPSSTSPPPPPPTSAPRSRFIHPFPLPRRRRPRTAAGGRVAKSINSSMANDSRSAAADGASTLSRYAPAVGCSLAGGGGRTDEAAAAPGGRGGADV